MDMRVVSSLMNPSLFLIWFVRSGHPSIACSVKRRSPMYSFSQVLLRAGVSFLVVGGFVWMVCNFGGTR